MNDMHAENTVLHFGGVEKSYDAKPVLKGLDFALSPGRIKGLLGLNGAGKTTLIEAALGLIPVDAGTIRTLGEDPANFSEAARAQIGYVPQDSEMFVWMTARVMLDFLRPFYARWNRERADALLRRWQVPEDTLIGNLSGGQRQRLAIVRALAHEPSLLILDEPVASLDPAGRRDFLKEVIDLTTEREVTVLFSTHIVSDLERVATDVAILHGQRILLDEPIDTLTDRTWRLTAARENVSWPAAPVLVEQAGNGVFQRIVVADESIVAASTASNLRADRLSLEDLLIELTQ
jgi:ABC-2 type transport system ATP-binding protein